MRRYAFLRSEAFLVFVLCVVDACFLFYAISTLSISYYEAEIFYNSDKISGILSRFFVSLLGQNDYALRLPFVICHIVSVVLLYKISKPILKRKFDRIVGASLFIFLPGVVASAILVNDAGMVILLTLLSVYLYQIRQILPFYLVLLAMPFVSGSFLVFFLALFIFAVYRRDVKLAWLSAFLFAVCFSIYGFETGGKPRGYFLDTLSVFAAVFSPLIFIYFVYCVYRIWVKEQKNIIWFICVTAFCLCLVVSIRQKLELESFLPFCVISTPLMVRVFFSSYRVRLPIFRIRHKILAVFSLLSLAICFAFILSNELMYKYIENPKKHFAYRYHIAKELADELKKQDILRVSTTDEKMALRLKFYGIENGGDKLINLDLNEKYANISIKKFGRDVAKFSIEKG